MNLENLPNNTGTVLSAEHVAVYRDAEGVLHSVSSVCTHAGCNVKWDDHEKLWRCHCHGSRFAPCGEVVRGPALLSLPAVELPEHEF
jgi:Rieske Fe-S protein